MRWIILTLTHQQKATFNHLVLPLLKHPEVRKMMDYTQHGDTSCLAHCLSVTYTSYVFSKRLGINIDEASLIRGALLHDFFLYDWHDKDAHQRFHGFRHPGIALQNARTYFDLNDIECDIISHHMWPLTPTPPHSKEAYIVTCMDKWCSIKETIKRPKLKRLMAKCHSLINI